MSEFTFDELKTSAIGFGQRAWFQTPQIMEDMRAAGRYFDGPVPREIAAEIVAWEPVTFNIPLLVDPSTMESYEMPDRYGTMVAHPVSKKIINIAGDGYNPTLHIEMLKAIELAADFDLEISTAVCLGEGRFIGLSLVPGDDIVFGDPRLGGMRPYLGVVSSLTGDIATGLNTGTLRMVCDNTIRAAWSASLAKLSRKRTRKSGINLTPDMIRTKLDFALKETEQLSLELERLCNVEVTDDQFKKILDIWSPVPEQEGRSKTTSLNRRSGLRGMMTDRRVRELGQTVGGITQAFNTWNTWEATIKGEGREDRVARRDMAAADGSTDAADAEFWKIVSSVVPELEKVTS